ncbi:MAG: 16S rRNA (uracil1498-N3)-methyltransferase [Paracoccaceae bacterium]|jgi:16S rRNA (uracil1498-N3)-methyltransferase
MPEQDAKIRLFVDAPLGQGAAVPLTRDQAHYLVSVMRQGVGAPVKLFNGRDGEWLAELAEAGKRNALAVCRAALRPQVAAPDLWLLFAPVKRTRTDFIVEKAVELGVSRLQPVFTRRTASERIRTDRMQTNAREAAEQSERLDIPEAMDGAPLALVLDALGDRRVMFCDERGGARPAAEALRAAGPGPWAVLIGPEGGFAPEEAEMLCARPGTVPVSLGPRILRADTAAVSALTIWQSTLGDWA